MGGHSSGMLFYQPFPWLVWLPWIERIREASLGLRMVASEGQKWKGVKPWRQRSQAGGDFRGTKNAQTKRA